MGGYKRRNGDAMASPFLFYLPSPSISIQLILKSLKENRLHLLMCIFPSGRDFICQALQNNFASLGMFYAKLAQLTALHTECLHGFNCDRRRCIFFASNNCRPTKQTI